MITCKEAHRLMVHRQDKPLGWRRRWSLMLHLRICDACRNFSSQLDFLRRAIHRHYGKNG
ncbi:MAG TPA: zf-HC2 domain-containing protein [Rhodocyclaceae bacterium]|nr:zf-HC2 domain-containing protein [Rhodocyclaceae bacterium]